MFIRSNSFYFNFQCFIRFFLKYLFISTKGTYFFKPTEKNSDFIYEIRKFYRYRYVSIGSILYDPTAINSRGTKFNNNIIGNE